MSKIRLTLKVIEALLSLNEGFSDHTSYSSKNFSESRDYLIKNGALHIHEEGKTSWADSRYSNDYVADTDQTRRFLRNNINLLNLGDEDD